MNQLVRGLASGAVGTVALNITTYLDMAIRGRPASEMPAQAVREISRRAGLSLSEEGPDSETAANRRSGLGALLGYATGLGVGALYGTIRPHARSVPLPLAALGLALTAMAGSDVPLTSLGLTDPRQWSPQSWASDIVPHAAYGVMTALTFEAFNQE